MRWLFGFLRLRRKPRAIEPLDPREAEVLEQLRLGRERAAQTKAEDQNDDR